MERERVQSIFEPSEEHAFLRQSLRQFVRMEVEPQAREYDRTEQFNLPLFRKLAGLGLLGMTVEEQYGGAGMDATAVVIAHEELSYSDPGFCLAYLAHALLATNNIAVNANDAQKARWLPQLCSGTWVGAMGMSEPQAGTDVLALTTTAEKVPNGYKINGRKMWITNGALNDSGDPCDCMLFYGRLSGDRDSRGKISSFVVEKGTQGFSVGQKITEKLGMRASNTAEMCFEDCILPAENLIGKEGQALTHMMRNLEIERVGLAAMSLGIARRCIDTMLQYAADRKAFGKTLNSFGQIQRYIGQSFAEYQACRSYVYNTALHLNLYEPGSRLDSDGVKLVTAPVAKAIADRAIQVLGGYGYVGEYNVERLWRDAKLLEIGGGTLEAHEKNIVKDLTKDGLPW